MTNILYSCSPQVTPPFRSSHPAIPSHPPPLPIYVLSLWPSACACLNGAALQSQKFLKIPVLFSPLSLSSLPPTRSLPVPTPVRSACKRQVRGKSLVNIAEYYNPRERGKKKRLALEDSSVAPLSTPSPRFYYCPLLGPGSLQLKKDECDN